MATLLETASLVMVPSGYEDGTLGSLVPTDASGDFTFTRGSNLSATRVNEDGIIEKGYENLLLQSNTFSAAAWTLYNISATEGQAGYDGSNDAWLISLTGGSGQIRNSVSTSGVQTFSVYAKSNTLPFLALYFVGSGEGQYFDLENGALGNVFISDTIDSSIESMGNGWYKCSITTNDNISQVRIYPTEANDTSATSGSIYIQDAQLNQGLVAYPYIETTAAPEKGGILADLPRVDYSSGRASLLLEPQRTNLINYSEPFEASGTPNWRTQNGTIVLSNEKPYFLNTYAAKYVPSSTGFNQIFITIQSLSVGSSYVNTYYLKPSGGIPYLFFEVGGRIKYNVSGNVLDPLPAGVSGGITQLQNGWLKATFIYDSVDSSINTNKVYASSTDNFTVGIPLNEYMLFTGCQFEQGSYPTSYIPTYGTSQTRLAEDLELPTLSSVFDSTGSFTLFFEIERLSSSVQQQILYIRGLGYFRLDATADNRLKFVIYGGGASVTEANSGINTFVAGTSSKIVYKQNGTIGQCFINGQEISSGVPTILTGFFTFYQRNENHIKHQEVYFPTALSDEACIELTTL